MVEKSNMAADFIFDENMSVLIESVIIFWKLLAIVLQSKLSKNTFSRWHHFSKWRPNIFKLPILFFE
jgi:hypothetical protein